MSAKYITKWWVVRELFSCGFVYIRRNMESDFSFVAFFGFAFGEFKRFEQIPTAFSFASIKIQLY